MGRVLRLGWPTDRAVQRFGVSAEDRAGAGRGGDGHGRVTSRPGMPPCRGRCAGLAQLVGLARPGRGRPVPQ